LFENSTTGEREKTRVEVAIEEAEVDDEEETAAAIIDDDDEEEDDDVL
jgi:hypothetical protein